MPDFTPTEPQSYVVGVLVELIGLTGVRRLEEQGGNIVLSVLPSSDTVSPFGSGQPFNVMVDPEGRVTPPPEEAP